MVTPISSPWSFYRLEGIEKFCRKDVIEVFHLRLSPNAAATTTARPPPFRACLSGNGFHTKKESNITRDANEEAQHEIVCNIALFGDRSGL